MSEPTFNLSLPSEYSHALPDWVNESIERIAKERVKAVEDWLRSLGVTESAARSGRLTLHINNDSSVFTLFYGDSMVGRIEFTLSTGSTP